MKTAHLREGIMQAVFTACACISILAVVLICVFLFANGLPTIGKIGPLKFLLGTTWKPGNDIYGILPMILGSLYVTAGAIIVGVPVGLLTAIYLSRFSTPAIKRVMLPAVQLLAGIPSVVYGFFGMIVLVPAVQAMVKSDFFKTVLHVKGGKGMSLFTASVLLGIMILPTIITVSKTSLDAVPESYYEGSLALGATHERSVFYAVLPAAKSGVLSAVILGIGRAIGDDGRRDGRGQPDLDAQGTVPGPAHDDLQHRHRDGLLHRPAPRSTDRHRRCAVRLHSPDQPLLQRFERRQGPCLIPLPTTALLCRT